MNIPGTETQNEIADIERVANMTMHVLEPRMVTGRRMPVLQKFINNRLPADAGNWRFACRINIRHYNPVCVVEGAAKLAAKCFRARIAMGLKHRQHSLAASRSCSL